MTAITIYSLFGDDVRMLGFTIDADDTFYALTSLSFFMFIVELIMACFCKDDYFLGFYFWLDLVSTLSLITDIGWIMDEAYGTGGSAGNAQ